MKYFRLFSVVVIFMILLLATPLKHLFINKCYAKYVYRYVKTAAIVRIK